MYDICSEIVETWSITMFKLSVKKPVFLLIRNLSFKRRIPVVCVLFPIARSIGKASGSGEKEKKTYNLLQDHAI